MFPQSGNIVDNMHSLTMSKDFKNVPEQNVETDYRRWIQHLDIITSYINLPIWFPVLGSERKCQDVIVITGLKNSKLPLLCVFGLVDQAVADLLNAGLQHKEINEQIHYLVSAFLSTLSSLYMLSLH